MLALAVEGSVQVIAGDSGVGEGRETALDDTAAHLVARESSFAHKVVEATVARVARVGSAHTREGLALFQGREGRGRVAVIHSSLYWYRPLRRSLGSYGLARTWVVRRRVLGCAVSPASPQRVLI